MGSKKNPRYSNGTLRRKYRARLKAMGCECGICHGRLGPIDYDAPSDAKHPYSFVIDEIKPVSRWKEFGYPSARAAAEDWNNLQAAHYYCNQMKRDKVGFTLGDSKGSASNSRASKDNESLSSGSRGQKNAAKTKINVIDGEW